MFGIIGKLVGGVAGGLLDKVGLGKIAPFVKTGLNLMTGNWLGVAEDVFKMVSGFKGNPLDKASKNPPLGSFEQPRNSFAGNNGSSPINGNQNSFSANQSPISGNRMTDLLRALSDLFRALADQGGGEGLDNSGCGNGGGINGGINGGNDGMRKILDALRTLLDSFGNNRLFNNRVSVSQFTNIRM